MEIKKIISNLVVKRNSDFEIIESTGHVYISQRKGP